MTAYLVLSVFFGAKKEFINMYTVSMENTYGHCQRALFFLEHRLLLWWLHGCNSVLGSFLSIVILGMNLS